MKKLLLFATLLHFATLLFAQKDSVSYEDRRRLEKEMNNFIEDQNHKSDFEERFGIGIMGFKAWPKNDIYDVSFTVLNHMNKPIKSISVTLCVTDDSTKDTVIIKKFTSNDLIERKSVGSCDFKNAFFAMRPVLKIEIAKIEYLTADKVKKTLSGYAINNILSSLDSDIKHPIIYYEHTPK